MTRLSGAYIRWSRSLSDYKIQIFRFYPVSTPPLDNSTHHKIDDQKDIIEAKGLIPSTGIVSLILNKVYQFSP